MKSQSAAVLAERLLLWADQDRHLLADLKAWAAQAQVANDPAAIKKVLGDLLKCNGFLDWRGSSEYARRAEKVLPLLEKVLVHDATQARALCDYALRRLYQAAAEADDSSGDIGGVMQGTMDVLMRSLKASPPAAEWVDDWLALMDADPYGLWSEEAVLNAAGRAVQQRYSHRVQKNWQAWVAAHPIQEEADSVGKKRGLVASGGRWDNERHKLRRRYVDDLKRQGDVLAVIEGLRTSMREQHEHSELVAYCETVGKLREALDYAFAAYKLFPNDWRSENDLLRCYERDGWDAEALSIRRRQLEKEPSVERYRAVLKAVQAAGQDIQGYRAELFACAERQELQQKPRTMAMYQRRFVKHGAGRDVSVRVAWLLFEKDWEPALQLVQVPQVCSLDLLVALEKMLPKARATDAVALLRRVFEFVMPAASTPYADVLALVAEAAQRMNQEQQALWLSRLRVEYKPKRNFIKGLDALGL